MEKMNWKKLGLYFLAGFGAYAVYNRYITHKKPKSLTSTLQERVLVLLKK